MCDEDRQPCKSCGASILPSTAQKNDGECMPCRGGYRVSSIAEGKLRRKKEKERFDAPDAVFWRSLVTRVYDENLGFSSLTEPEKLFFALCLLEGEVYNGGIEQFFTNSSGDYYTFSVMGLEILNADVWLSLLLEAKHLLFGNQDVPTNTEMRRRILLRVDLDSDESEISRSLNNIDKRFYEELDLHTDTLGNLIRRFGIEQGFWNDLP